MTNNQTTLTIFQQAVFMLAQWANIDFNHSYPTDSDVIKKAKNILGWDNKATFQALGLLFDRVTLDKGQSQTYYVPAIAIADEYPLTPYPISEEPSLDELKDQIKKDLNNIQLEQNWNNLSLLTLIVEKYGSYISLSKGDNNNDIAFYDLVRSISAVAEALSKNPEQENLTLIAGDLSGIQDFIYTISSEGALKSLRARSFYLGLVAEEIVCQILEKLDLPRTNIIYAGGGNLYILAPANEETYKIVPTIQKEFNEWLLKEFQGKIFLGLSYSEEFSPQIVNGESFANIWNSTIKKLNNQKSQKFIQQINTVLTIKDSYSQKCQVCHRDDTNDLKEINKEDGDSELACPTCREMSELGSYLLKVKYFMRSSSKKLQSTYSIKTNKSYYHVFTENDFKTFQQSKNFQSQDILYLVNNWKLTDYQLENSCSFVIGNYARKSQEEEGKMIRSGELARKAEGVQRIGYLRMDVDNLGQIFAKGLGDFYNLPRLASLSRQLSYFFTVYLTSLANNRQDNFINAGLNTDKAKYLTTDNKGNLVFIYAGGDDLFVSGSWNEVVEFAFDIYQAFRAYTGYNPDITLSGGICLGDIKFPLYQAAMKSGEAEHKAKGNGRDSLGLFGQVFKWDEWLGNSSIIDKFDDEIKHYLKDEPIREPFGVLPIVKLLNSIGYSRSFIRNLLIVADIQDQKLKEIEDQQKSEPYDNYKKDICYYLHLPKIAYTLARLSQSIKQTEDYNKLSQSLKSPHNAPYFRAIATWIELLNRQPSHDNKNDNND